jgi:hypothetical protein
MSENQKSVQMNETKLTDRMNQVLSQLLQETEQQLLNTKRRQE